MSVQRRLRVGRREGLAARGELQVTSEDETERRRAAAGLPPVRAVVPF